MCKDGDRCSRPVCFFAHGPHELRTPSDPTPLPQHMDVSAMAAANAAAAALPMQSVSANTASLAAGAGSSWQLVHGLPGVSGDSGGMTAIHNATASTSTGGPSAGPAGLFMGPACSASALLSSAGAGLQHAGTVGGGGVQSLGIGGVPGPAGAGIDAGAAAGMLNDQALRLLQQANSSGQSDLTVQQLLSSMMQQVNMSRQEAEQCRNAAAQAQQQLMAMTVSLNPQGASDTSPGMAAGGPLTNLQQQLQLSTDAAGLRGNLESYASDVSSNLTYMDLSSASFGSMSSQHQLYSAAAAAANGNVWRTDSNSSMMLPVLSRTGSGTGSGVINIPASNPSRLMRLVTGDGSGPLGLGVPVTRGDSSGPLMGLDAGGAAGLQQLQQALGVAGSAGSDQRMMMLGASMSQMGGLQGQQQLQQMAGVPGLQGAIAVSTSGPAGSTPLMYLL